MNDLIAASKKVGRRPGYIIFGLIAGAALIVVAIWLPNISFIGSTLASPVLSIGEKTSILAASLSALNTNFTPLSRGLILALAALFAIDAAFMAFYLRTRMRLERAAGMSIGGVILGLLGVGCASCGTVAVSAFFGAGATAGVLALLPLKGEEFGILGVIFMALGVFLAAKKIEQPLACAVVNMAPSDDRHGARQHDRFDPSHAGGLDDPARLSFLPPEGVLDAADMPNGGTLIDFGTGTGTYAIPIAKQRPDAKIVAFDEQPAMLDRMRAKPESANLPNLAIVSDAEIGRYRGKGDRIIAVNVLHELGDAALERLKTLLAKHGSALFVDWNGAMERPVGPPADHVYTPDEAARRLAAAGFATTPGPAFPYHYSIIARRAG